MSTKKIFKETPEKLSTPEEIGNAVTHGVASLMVISSLPYAVINGLCKGTHNR